MSRPQNGSYDANYTNQPKKLSKRLPEARLPNGAAVNFGNGSFNSQETAPKKNKKTQPQPQPQAQSQAQAQNTLGSGKKTQEESTMTEQKKSEPKKKKKSNKNKNKNNGEKTTDAAQNPVQSPLSSPDLKHAAVNSNYTLGSGLLRDQGNIKKTTRSGSPSSTNADDGPSYAGHSFTNAPDVGSIPKPTFL